MPDERHLHFSTASALLEDKERQRLDAGQPTKLLIAQGIQSLIFSDFQPEFGFSLNRAGPIAVLSENLISCTGLHLCLQHSAPYCLNLKHPRSFL
jgi:hypothetical protein